MESIKNALGLNKEEGASEEHTSHHHLPGHHKTADDQTTSTAATSHDPTASTHHKTTTDNPTTSTTTTSHGEHASTGDIPSKPTPTGHHGGDDVQQAQAHKAVERVESGKSEASGADPALVGDPNPKDKLVGTGAPGSHSAVFGLTPDGKANTDTAKGSGAPKPAHSKETAIGGGQESSEGDTGSRAPTGNPELSEQLQKSGTDHDTKGGQNPGQAPLAADGDLRAGGSQTAGSTGNI